jgi:hypothetical protein
MLPVCSRAGLQALLLKERGKADGKTTCNDDRKWR